MLTSIALTSKKKTAFLGEHFTGAQTFPFVACRSAPLSQLAIPRDIAASLECGVIQLQPGGFP